jgi:hypothetical protein
MMMLRVLGAALAAVVACDAAPLAARAQSPTALPPCAPAQLRLSTAPSEGAGMLHDTRFFVVTNVGTTTCSVPGLPSLTISDASGAPIVANAGPPKMPYMHPGPVVLPLALEPGDAIRIDVRWAVGNGSARNTNCFAAASATLAGATTPFATTICGDDVANAKPGVSVTRYQRVAP